MSEFERLISDFSEVVGRLSAGRDPRDITQDEWKEIELELRSRWGGTRIYVPAPKKPKRENE